MDLGVEEKRLLPGDSKDNFWGKDWMEVPWDRVD
jgi:hypothetical protein